MQGVKVLTQEKYNSIPALLEQGLDRTQIATLLGLTPASLQVQCSRRGISLRQGGRRTPVRNLSLADARLDLNDNDGTVDAKELKSPAGRALLQLRQ
jgi:hypothetical protein